MSLYIIPFNLGYGTRAALSSSIKHHGQRKQVLPFLDPSWFLNPLNDPVFNHTAPWAVGCTPRDARETGEDRSSPKKGPTISNCRYSEAFTLRFGAVSCENKKLTSDGRASIWTNWPITAELRESPFVYLCAIIIALARYLWSDV